jgi:4-amino-4-deoxy-L-arabinose transferase-like glycosyltransferase
MNATQSSHARRIFLVAFSVRLAAAAALSVLLGGYIELSRDSLKYHIEGQRIAEVIFSSRYNWSMWIDHGWYQLIGLVYYLIGPYLWLITLLNALAAGATASLVYRIGLVTFEDEASSRLAGYLCALFPSLVYYTCLPLKEAVAIFAIVGIIWGILELRVAKKKRGLIWILSGLLIIVGVRVYLAYVLGGCTVLCLTVTRAKGDFAAIVRLAVSGAALLFVVVAIINASGVDLAEHEHFKYFDLNYINHVRSDMNTGEGKMFSSKEEAELGEDPVSSLYGAIKGIAFFFMSIDVTSIQNERQMAALPEVLLLLLCLPYLFSGIITGWRHMAKKVLPLLLFGAAIVAVYSGTATNMGAMYRWRLQALPMLILLICFGAAVRRRGPLYSIICRMRAATNYTHEQRPVVVR